MRVALWGTQAGLAMAVLVAGLTKPAGSKAALERRPGLGCFADRQVARRWLPGAACGWAAAFGLFHVLLQALFPARAPALRRWLATPRGMLIAAAAYGPLVWLVMSLAVLPLLLDRPPAVTGRWWVQLVGHAVFLGLPIAWAFGPGGGPRAAARDSYRGRRGSPNADPIRA